MRILLADWGTTMRGGQWQCLYLLRGLEKLGFEVELLARGELLKRAGQPAGVVALRRWSGMGRHRSRPGLPLAQHCSACIWFSRCRLAPRRLRRRAGNRVAMEV